MDVFQAENTITLLKAGSFVDYGDLTSAIHCLFNNDLLDTIDGIVRSEVFEVSTNYPYSKDKYGDDESFPRLLNLIYDMSSYDYIKEVILKNGDSSRNLTQQIASNKQESFNCRLIAIKSLLQWANNCQHEINQIIDSLDENDDSILIDTIANLGIIDSISIKAKAKQEQFNKIKEQSKEIKMEDISRKPDNELVVLIEDNKISKEDVINICFDFSKIKKTNDVYIACVDFLAKNNALTEVAGEIFIGLKPTRFYSENKIKNYFHKKCIEYNVETRKLVSTSHLLSKENFELLTSEYCNLDVVNNLVLGGKNCYQGLILDFIKRTENKYFLSAIFEKDEYKLKIAVAESKFAPANDLKKFIKETSAFDFEEGNYVGLGLTIASNQDTPADVLETFYAEGKDVGKIFHALANNPNYKYATANLQNNIGITSSEVADYIKSRSNILTKEQIDLLFSNRSLQIFLELVDCKNVDENTIAGLINYHKISHYDLIEKLSKKDSHVIRMAIINQNFRGHNSTDLVKNILEFNNQEEIEKLKEISKNYQFIKNVLVEKGILPLDKFEKFKGRSSNHIVNLILGDYEKKEISTEELDFILDCSKNRDYDRCEIVNAAVKHPNVSSATLINNIEKHYGNHDLFHNLVTHKDENVAIAAINKFDGILYNSHFINALKPDINDKVFIALVNSKQFSKIFETNKDLQKAFLEKLKNNIEKYGHDKDYFKYDFTNEDVIKFVIANCDDHNYLWKRYEAITYTKEFLSNQNLPKDGFQFIERRINSANFSDEVKAMIKNHKFSKIKDEVPKEEVRIDFSDPNINIQKVRDIIDGTEKYDLTKEDYKKIVLNSILFNNLYIRANLYVVHRDSFGEAVSYNLNALCAASKDIEFLKLIRELSINEGQPLPMFIESQIANLELRQEQQRKKNRSIKQRSIEDFNEAIYLGAAIKTQNVISSMFNSNDKTINNVLKSDGFKAVASFILGTIIAEINPENNHIKTYADKCRELAIATVGASAFDAIISTVFKDKQNIRIAIPNEAKQINSNNLTDEELFVEQMVSSQKNGMVN